MAPSAYQNISAADSSTRCSVVAKSFAWADETEKIGKVVKPKKPAASMTPTVPVPLAAMVTPQLRTATADSQIRTQRRSYLSASQPIGYCANAPPNTNEARKNAI